MGTLFKEARSLLVGRQASPILMIKFICSVMPLSLMFVLPISFLTGIMITVGRLSNDNEIISMQMAGRGLIRIAMPVFSLATILCGFCFWINIYAAPKAKSAQKQILFEAVQQDPSRLLDPGVIQTQLKNQLVYLEDRKNADLFGLHVFELDQDKEISFPKNYLHAEEAQLFFEQEAKELRLHLRNAHYHGAFEPNTAQNLYHVGEQKPLLFKFKQKSLRKYHIGTMTNTEIYQALSSDAPEVIKAITTKKRISMNNELFNRNSFSVACLALAFMGFPLALNKKRKESSKGILLSIGFTLLYFGFFLVAKDMQDKPGILTPFLFIVPNLMCLLAGIYFFRKLQKR